MNTVCGLRRVTGINYARARLRLGLGLRLRLELTNIYICA